MSTMRDACARHGLEVGSEVRLPVVRMFRRCSAHVKANAGVVTIMSINKAARLVQLVTGDQALVNLLAGLRHELPPALYRHAGSRDDAYREADEAMMGGCPRGCAAGGARGSCGRPRAGGRRGTARGGGCGGPRARGVGVGYQPWALRGEGQREVHCL